MSLFKSDDFIADLERQFAWYGLNAGWEVADRYLEAVEATCRLLEQHPLIGPLGRFTHPRLKAWRLMMAFRPFQKHLLFYEVAGSDVVMRRAMHGHRDLRHRLIEPPSSV